MKLASWLSFLRWTRVAFGTGHLDRLIIFECKYLFSIYLNVWNTIKHDRFHTHAFASFSFMLRGQYQEEQLVDGRVRRYTLKAPMVRFIPRTSNHRMLLASKNAISLTVAGPWDRLWTETFPDGTKRLLTWGRQDLITGQVKKENE